MSEINLLEPAWGFAVRGRRRTGLCAAHAAGSPRPLSFAGVVGCDQTDVLQSPELACRSTRAAHAHAMAS